MANNNALLESLQKQIDELNKKSEARDKADAGDPQAAGLLSLKAGIVTSANMHPTKDYSALVEAVTDLPDVPTVEQAQYIRELIEDHNERYSSAAQDFGNLRQLAKEQYLYALKAKSDASAPAVVENDDDDDERDDRRDDN
jgi:hypothetical protein